MNYATFKAKRSALHIAYHSAKRASDEIKIRQIDAEIGQLEEEGSRDYQISDRMLIRVYVRSHMISIGAARIDRGVNLVQLPHFELECFDPEELKVLSGLRAVVGEYETGEIDELPTSGVFDHTTYALRKCL